MKSNVAATGLVVDVRANGGGNGSRMIVERLCRKGLGVNCGRTDTQGDTYPDGEDRKALTSAGRTRCGTPVFPGVVHARTHSLRR